MKPLIEVIVSPQGETQLETKGFEGPVCQQASRKLEHLLGCKLHEQRTAEFYATTGAAEEVRQHNNAHPQ